MDDNRFSFEVVVRGRVRADTEEHAVKVVQNCLSISSRLLEGIRVEIECYPMGEDAHEPQAGPSQDADMKSVEQSILEKIDKGFDAVAARLQNVGNAMTESNAEVARSMHEIVGGLREMTGANVLQRPQEPADPAPVRAGGRLKTVIQGDPPQRQVPPEVPPEPEEEDNVGNSASSPPPEPAPRRPGRRAR